MKLLLFSLFSLYFCVKTVTCSKFEIDSYSGEYTTLKSKYTTGPGKKIPYGEFDKFTFHVPENSEIRSQIVDEKYYCVLLTIKLPKLSRSLGATHALMALCNAKGKDMKNPKFQEKDNTEEYNLLGSLYVSFTKEKVLGRKKSKPLKIEVIEQKAMYDTKSLEQNFPKKKAFDYSEAKKNIKKLGTTKTITDTIDVV